MRAPFVLRWAVAWAALIGNYVAISVATIPGQQMAYRFDVHAQTVKQWRERTAERRRMTDAEANAQRRKSDMDGAFWRGFILALALVLLGFMLYNLIVWIMQLTGVI